MRKKAFCILSLLVMTLTTTVLSGCGDSASANKNREKRQSTIQMLTPQQTGSVVYGNGITSIDASNTSDGYIMVSYKGSAAKAKIQITIPNGTVYTYTTTSGRYETFPLTGGSGNYHIDVLENAYDNMYSLGFARDFSVTIADEFSPFLYPNQYVWYTEESNVVSLSKELSDQSYDDLSFVENVYYYVTKNVTYDDELAATVSTDYLPNVDKTIEIGKGICFDYASLMAAMLRSQSIPTRLEIGYSGEAYHAWISVYLKETGWVDKIIEFDGSSWALMDPTLASNNSNRSVQKYVGDGSNYTVKYSY